MISVCQKPSNLQLDRVTLNVINGLSLPESVGSLRYEQYVREQGKKYPSADHEKSVLFDEADAQSVHIVCFSERGELLSALRLTQHGIACNINIFRALTTNNLIKDSTDENTVILSRLVRSRGMEGAKSVQHIFRYCFEYCVNQGWEHGLIHTSPKLRPLFIRYGWKQIADEYYDDYAGQQVLLHLNALDRDHLEQIKSPYLSI